MFMYVLFILEVKGLWKAGFCLTYCWDSTICYFKPYISMFVLKLLLVKLHFATTLSYCCYSFLMVGMNPSNNVKVYCQNQHYIENQNQLSAREKNTNFCWSENSNPHCLIKSKWRCHMNRDGGYNLQRSYRNRKSLYFLPFTFQNLQKCMKYMYILIKIIYRS